MSTPSWKVQTRPPAPLAKVAYVNACCDIAFGSHGTIVTSTDGRNPWIKRNSYTDVQLRGVSAVGLCHAWPVGDDGTIIATCDAEPSGKT